LLELTQGFTLNESKLKTGKSKEYFDKLHMKDWIKQLDIILKMNKKDLLTHHI
jgi:hypothetical protein